MSIDTWGMKLLGLVFGKQQLIRIENIKLLYNKSEQDKQLIKIREKLDSSLIWNTSFAMLGTIGLVFTLQRIFPNYGRRFSVGTFVIDIGIFSLSAGLSFLYSLQQMEAEMVQIRKKWINEHNPDYIKSMNYMQKSYDITLLEQIQPYVPAHELSNWKFQYDEVFKRL